MNNIEIFATQKDNFNENKRNMYSNENESIITQALFGLTEGENAESTIGAMWRLIKGEKDPLRRVNRCDTETTDVPNLSIAHNGGAGHSTSEENGEGSGHYWLERERVEGLLYDDPNKLISDETCENDVYLGKDLNYVIKLFRIGIPENGLYKGEDFSKIFSRFLLTNHYFKETFVTVLGFCEDLKADENGDVNHCIILKQKFVDQPLMSYKKRGDFEDAVEQKMEETGAPEWHVREILLWQPKIEPVREYMSSLEPKLNEKENRAAKTWENDLCEIYDFKSENVLITKDNHARVIDANIDAKKDLLTIAKLYNQTIFSIGHGTKTKEEFVSELHSHGIQFLVDIRSKPYSRFCPHFSQQALKKLVESENIKYVYMGTELGGLPMHDLSCFTKEGKVDYNELKNKDYFRNGLLRLLNANAQGLRVCIMCSERDPKMCHRSKLIGNELQKEGVLLHHIIGVSKVLTQGQVVDNSLFIETNLTSKKVYLKGKE